MLIVLSPAKRLDMKAVDFPGKSTEPRFLEEASELIGELRKFSPKDLSNLMNVNAKIADLNQERFSNWTTPFTKENAKPCLFAFQGDVFRGLEASSLSEKALDFGQEHLRILSGLYGVLRPLDLMQAYRLEMSTKLSNPKGKDLYEFWNGKIAEALNEDLEQQGDNLLVNLASQEYFKSIDPDTFKGKILTPVFKEKKNGKYKVIGIKAKRARGLMTRFILENNITDPEHLKAFDTEGYLFNEGLSSDDEWVFSRDQE